MAQPGHARVLEIAAAATHVDTHSGTAKDDKDMDLYVVFGLIVCIVGAVAAVTQLSGGKTEQSRPEEMEMSEVSGGGPPVNEELMPAHKNKSSHVSEAKKSNRSAFAYFGLVFEVFMVAVLAWLFTYGEKTEANGKEVTDGGAAFYYPMYQDVHVMIYVGFGFLMTFLRRHGFGSVGLNFMVAAYVLQWAIVSKGLLHKLIGHMTDDKIALNMEDLIFADFAAGAVLISFGAVLGRVSPFQLLIMSIFEIVVYHVNEHICVTVIGASDMGGSMLVHCFGAYFGLAVALAMGIGKYRRYLDHAKNGSSKNSDMYAMVGTLFLWIFWPSFTGAMAEEEQKFRVILNTVLALAASCAAAFSFTLIFSDEKKFGMVEIQNSTLAGGVAIGSACNLLIGPWAAVAIGIFAAFVSVWGYIVFSPMLEKTFGLFDTCGVHNLHGMPGVIGGIVGMIAVQMADPDKYLKHGDQMADIWENFDKIPKHSQLNQTKEQFCALVLSIAMACSSGYAVGLVMDNPMFEPMDLGTEFEDSHYWQIEDPAHVEEKGQGNDTTPATREENKKKHALAARLVLLVCLAGAGGCAKNLFMDS